MTKNWLKSVARSFQPLVSVVIPVHNVERYLRECLDSVLAQSHRRLQIIAVDDGSTDASADILREYTKREPRLSVITQPNRGLGAARNAGLQRAKGKFLFFVDSDDTLPPKAIETLVQSFRKCRADFAVGNLRRVSASERYVPRWAKTAHQTTQLGTNVRAQPAILYNVFAWTKMYRADFFRSAIGRWPEGTLYEDQLPALQAYAASTSINILNDVVYNWRIRDDSSSITQNKTSLRDLQDRVNVMHAVLDALEAFDDRRLAQRTLAKWIGHDFLPYYVAAPQAGPAYAELLAQALGELTQRADESVWKLVPVHERIRARAAARGAVADLETINRSLEENGRTMPVTRSGDMLLGHPHYLQYLHTLIPARDLAVTKDGVLPDFILIQTNWNAENCLCVLGEARLPLVGLPLEDAEITAEMIDTEGTAIVPLPTSASVETANPAAELSATSAQALTFSTLIDPRFMPIDQKRHRWMCRLQLRWQGWSFCSLFNKIVPGVELGSRETECGETYSTYFAGQTGLVWKRAKTVAGRPSFQSHGPRQKGAGY